MELTAKSRLQAAGYNYDAIQAEVNRLSGRGSAPARRVLTLLLVKLFVAIGGLELNVNAELQAAGYDYNAVQRRVNQLL